MYSAPKENTLEGLTWLFYFKTRRGGCLEEFSKKNVEINRIIKVGNLFKFVIICLICLLTHKINKCSQQQSTYIKTQSYVFKKTGFL